MHIRDGRNELWIEDVFFFQELSSSFCILFLASAAGHGGMPRQLASHAAWLGDIFPLCCVSA